MMRRALLVGVLSVVAATQAAAETRKLDCGGVTFSVDVAGKSLSISPAGAAEFAEVEKWNLVSQGETVIFMGEQPRSKIAAIRMLSLDFAKPEMKTWTLGNFGPPGDNTPRPCEAVSP